MLYVSIPLGPALSGLPYGLGSLGDLIGNTVGFGIVIGAVFALIWLLTGGLTWITSSGDKAKVEEARDRITQAIIGLAIVMSVWAIWTLVTSRFFGLNLSGGGRGSGGGGSGGGVKSGCSIVQTDQGPGCWCAVGDWQFHCAAGAGRGVEASQTCVEDCGKRNGQPL